MSKKNEAVINQPSKKDYDKISKVVKGYQDQVNWLLNAKNPLNQSFALLQASDKSLQSTMLQFEQLSRLAANDQVLLMQDSARLANLKGPPPPEESAESVLVGKVREPWKPVSQRGRQALRIDRSL